MQRLRGTFTALITPFKADGTLDEEGFRRLVRLQLEAGVAGIVPLGSTGESSTIEREEQDRIIKASVEEAQGRLTVIVGAGSNSTKHAVENVRRAKELGADIAMVVSPYYNKPTGEGLFRHYQAVCEVGLPVLVYNIAGRTARNIETTVLTRIAELPGIAGVKEGSGDITQIMDVIQGIGREKSGFSVLSGDDALAYPTLALGGDGLISTAANLVPGRVSDLVDAALEGDMETARIRHFDLLPLFRGLFIETNPIPIKQAMAWAGLPAGPCRLPLCEMEGANIEKLKAALKAVGVK
jgi:4-hydroxy-tetrahydrodipicolinate synthase